MTPPIAPQCVLQVTRDVRWLDHFGYNLALAQIRKKSSADRSALLRRLLRIPFPIQVFFQLRQPKLVCRFFECQCAPPLVTTEDRTCHPDNAKEMGSPYGESGGCFALLRIIRSFRLHEAVLPLKRLNRAAAWFAVIVEPVCAPSTAGSESGSGWRYRSNGVLGN
jgi:hypothetical protein